MAQFRTHLLMGLCMAVIVFYGLGVRGLDRSSEGRVAQVAQEMRETGDWIVPHLNGNVRKEKPPLSSWLVAGISLLAGTPRVEAWHAFVAPGVAAIALVLLVCLWCGGPGGAQTPSPGALRGTLAALFLGTAPGFIVQARSAELDMLLALWVALAFWGFWRFHTAGCWRSLLAAYAALALSILTKGHVGLLIVIPALIAWSLLERRATLTPSPRGREQGEGDRPPWQFHLLGVALACALILPWAIPFLQRSGISWADFSKEGLQRFGEQTGHQEAWYWYFGEVPLRFLPWFALLPFALWQTWRLPADELTPLRRLCWVWLGWSFLLFSALTAKQHHYAIPFYAPLAMLIADAVARWLEHPDDGRRKAARWALGGAGLLLALGCAAAPSIASRRDSLAPFVNSLVWTFCVVAALSFAAAAWGVIAHSRLSTSWWGATMCLVAAFSLTVERRDRADGPQRFCAAVRGAVPAKAELYDYSVVFANNTYRAHVLFYLQHPVKRPDTPLPELLAQARPDTYILATAKQLESVPRESYRVLVAEKAFLGHKNDVFLIRSRPRTP